MENQLAAIKRIEKRAEEIGNVISLAQGIPSLPSHTRIRQEVIHAIQENKVDKYSPIAGLTILRNEISKKLSQKNMLYDPETEILITAGGIEALYATIISLVDKDDEVLFPMPAYPYYEKIIHAAKGKPVPIPLNEQNKWSLDIPLLEKKITNRTKLIIICNPNNPTGTVYSETELLAIGKLAQEHGFLIIYDDIYENFYYKETPLFNLCTQNQFRDQMIRIVSFSKDFSLSGWRAGFIHTEKKYLEKILAVHDIVINCAPVVSQYAALAALKHETRILYERMPIYKKRRTLMGKYLEKLQDAIDFTYPDGAYYFFPSIKGVNNIEHFCFDMLERAKVAVVPGDDFGTTGKGHVRLCFGKSEEDIREGMERMTKYLTTFS